MEAGWVALMSAEVVARVFRRTLASVVIEESNLMVEIAVERRTSRSLGYWECGVMEDAV